MQPNQTELTNQPINPAIILASVPIMDDVIEYTIACALALSPPALRSEMRERIAKHADAQARRVFGGQRNYIATRTPSARQQIIQNIRRQFNGVNLKDIIQQTGVSRRTVYRAVETAKGT